MTQVSCWLSECKWCENGWCNRNIITIDEDMECEDFEHFRNEYKCEYCKQKLKSKHYNLPPHMYRVILFEVLLIPNLQDSF